MDDVDQTETPDLNKLPPPLTEVDDSQPQTFDAEGTYVCESCGEEIVIPIDPVAGQSQSYVEDCPVCCAPMVIHVHFDGSHAEVRAESEQDRF